MGRVAGGPWPFNMVGSRARAWPVLGQGTSDEQAPELGRDRLAGGCGDSGGWLTVWVEVRGGQSGEPGQASDALMPV